MKVIFKQTSDSTQDHIVQLDSAGVTALYASEFVKVRIYQSNGSWKHEARRVTGLVLNVSENEPFIEVTLANS